MTKLELAKAAAKNTVGWSTSFVIGSIIRNNATPQTKLQEVEIVVASFVLGGLVAEAASEYTDRQIDSAVAWWNANVKKP
jgi:hypothetical protein